MNDDDVEVWVDACNEAMVRIKNAGPMDRLEVAEMEATELLALSRQLCYVECTKCSGRGQVVYASTSTWRGGLSGQMLTTDVCDRCWGTGRKDRKGIDLRRLYNNQKR